jgi:hypothetical protein
LQNNNNNNNNKKKKKACIQDLQRHTIKELMNNDNVVGKRYLKYKEKKKRE